MLERKGDIHTLDCGEKVAAYLGETGRNVFTRGLEHLESLESRNKDKSVLWIHSVYHHQRRVGERYSMRVSGRYKDSLVRKCMERIHITNFSGQVLINKKNEMGGVRIEITQYRMWGSNS